MYVNLYKSIAANNVGTVFLEAFNIIATYRPPATTIYSTASSPEQKNPSSNRLGPPPPPLPLSRPGVEKPEGPSALQPTTESGSVGAKADRGERGERGVKGEKGIQGDNTDVLSVLAEHLPILLPTRYGETMCFIK